MPQVLIGALVSWGVSLAVATAISYAIVIGAYYAYGTYQARKARAAARDAFNADLKDRLVMTTTTDAARSRVYGRVRNVDGVLFKATHGAKLEFYTFVVALAGHECDGVEQVYFGDLPVTLDGSGQVLDGPYRLVEKRSKNEALPSTASGSFVCAETPLPGTVYVQQADPVGSNDQPQPLVSVSVVGNTVSWSGGVAGWTTGVAYQYEHFTHNARVRSYLGGAGQDLSIPLTALGIPGVGASHKFQGICCLLITLTYHVDSFPQGVPGFSARIRGKKIHDPRTGLTVFSRNPALIARDWSYFPGGGACVAGEVDEDLLEDGANACDVSQVFALDGVAQPAAPMYLCDMVCPGDADPSEVLQQIVMSMAGKYAWCGGVLRIKAGNFTASVITIDESWLSGVGAIEMQAGVARQDLVNIFRPSISDASQHYVVAPTKEVRAAAYVTADGQELPRELTMAAITDVVHAQHVAACMLRDSRQALTVALPCNLKAYPLQVFDTVAVTLSRFGWSSKLFEVLTWAWSPTGGVLLTLKETAASIWDPLTNFTTTDEAPNTNLPLPWVVPEPTGLVVTSGVVALIDGSIATRVHLVWNPTTVESVAQSGTIEIQYTRYLDGIPPADWQVAPPVAGSATEAILVGLLTNTAYLFRIRQVNSLGVKSAWGDQRMHTVARPPSIIPDWTDIAGRPMLLRIVTRGQLDAAAPVLAGLYYLEAQTPLAQSPAGGTRSYRVNVIQRSTGAIIVDNSYDVFISGANATALANGLNSLGNDYIVIVRGEHEPQTNRLQADMLAAMLRCGASRAVFGSPEFKFRSSYVLVGIPGCGEGNGYEAYNGQVDNDPNAWCDVQLQFLAGNFTIGGTGATPRSIRDYSYTGTLDATTDLTLIARGFAVIAGNYGSKVGGTYAWDSDIYSRDSAFGACFAQATIVSNDCLIGLNTDPTTDSSYASIDFSLFADSGGNLTAYESGVGHGPLGTYVPGDVLTVVYDGAQIKYLKNGVLLPRGLVTPGPNLTFFLDTSFAQPGAALRNMRFGILTDVSWQNIINVSVTTPQIAPNAATEVFTDDFDFAGASYATTTVRSFTITPPSSCTIEITGSIVGTNVLPDSGSSCGWWVTPASTGVAVPLPGANCPSVSTARTQFTFQGSMAAAAGDTLLFELKTRKLIGGAPNMVLGVSLLRLTQVKR